MLAGILPDGLAELDIVFSEPREASDQPSEGGGGGGGGGGTRKPLRIWAVSDIHSDMKDNMAWVRSVASQRGAFSEDCLIVAGDVASCLETIRETLAAFKAAFRYVFFVPGNHDLWCRVGRGTALDSLDKFRAIMALCDELGVLTKPAELPPTAVGGQPLLVVPILSWHHQSFDTEPPIDPSWSGIPPVEKCLNDYHMCRWPKGLAHTDDTVAQHFDDENDRLWAGSPVADGCLPESAGKRFAAVISFSHFLPRIELCPEKRFLTFPTLLQAVGSTFLGARVARLRPDVHVFGHTHFGWDAVLDGVRYVQAPLSYPAERRARSFTVALEGWCPAADKLDEGPQEPFLVWIEASGGTEGGFLPKRRGGAWANFYEHYARRPQETRLMPMYVAMQFEWRGAGEPPVGWAGQAPAAAFVDAADLMEPYIERIEKELAKEDLAKLGGGFARLGPGDLAARLQRATAGSGPHIWLFDVRPLPDFERGHLEGALSVPLDSLMRLAMVQPRSRRLAILERLTDSSALKVVCDAEGGDENLRATRILRMIVSARTNSFLRLSGGPRNWRTAGLPEATGHDDGLPPAEGT
uniref:Rhodanese domain-containing protein n=1 Tax=Alexandrium monilatum TaxID=311494 RepID=A0A7S4SLW8_9DINO